MYNDDFIMSPKVDFAFKEIMFSAKVRKGFLSAVLDIPVDSIKETVLKNTNLQKVHDDEKLSILDVRLLMNDNTEIDIEIQLAYMSSWADRSAFYLSKMLVEQVGVDKKYSNLKKCIAINLLDFNYIRETKRFHTVYHISEDTEHIKYTDVMEWHVVELPKLPAMEDGTSLYDWIRFIKADSREEFEMLAKKNEYLEEAYKCLEVISQDEQKRLEYTARQKALYDYNTLMEENYLRGEEKGIVKGIQQGIKQGIQQGIKQGIQQGIIQGKAEERKNLAEQMRADGVDERIIEKYFGLNY